MAQNPKNLRILAFNEKLGILIERSANYSWHCRISNIELEEVLVKNVAHIAKIDKVNHIRLFSVPVVISQRLPEVNLQCRASKPASLMF